jgi:hypothetical protein
MVGGFSKFLGGLALSNTHPSKSMYAVGAENHIQGI